MLLLQQTTLVPKLLLFSKSDFSFNPCSSSPSTRVSFMDKHTKSPSLKQSHKQFQSSVLACQASTDTHDTSFRLVPVYQSCVFLLFCLILSSAQIDFFAKERERELNCAYNCVCHIQVCAVLLLLPLLLFNA